MSCYLCHQSGDLRGTPRLALAILVAAYGTTCQPDADIQFAFILDFSRPTRAQRQWPPDHGIIRGVRPDGPCHLTARQNSV